MILTQRTQSITEKPRRSSGKSLWQIILLGSTAFGGFTCAQQVSDTTYAPASWKPHFHKEELIVIHIDESHHNFHTKNGRYKAFAKVLENDGLIVEPWTKELSAENLRKTRAIVISNALNEANEKNWDMPNPSAFTEDEITDLQNWVQEGGSLFLIADHMPFAGAASGLASAFGFKIMNGFVIDTNSRKTGDVFRKDSGLSDNVFTKGIDSIATFSGEGFEIPEGAVPIIRFDKRFTLLLPQKAWVFDKDCEKKSAEGLYGLATLNYGTGKVILSAEAAMFSAQTTNGKKTGMNTPAGSQNYKLLLNLVRWLME
jgi:hypothetical protein